MRILLRAAAGFLAIIFTCGSVSHAGTTVAVSIDRAGNTGNDHSNTPAISADGRYVAFQSLADDLVPGDTNKKWDIFVRDLQKGETNIVSRDNAGNAGNNDSNTPAISADGR
ncbi:MAG TPA: hypothetical protein VN604_07780, partial [Nitrospirota bacterium]|nr:hypothetical protein [Nitrospirota bacterium]